MNPAPDDFTPASVVIPAHNEEAVIARCLTTLGSGAQEGELDIVVVCNGCQDATAEVARRVAPNATVIEISLASKVAALNAGDRSAKYFPRFYLDADIELSVDAVRKVARVLGEDGALFAAPKPVFAVDGRPWAIRAFYDIWKTTPYRSEDMTGGVYALSEEGRSRFEAFPELTADDQFVQQLFERTERKAVEDASFVVQTPRALRGLLSMRARVYRGNRELASSGLTRSDRPASGTKSALRRALKPAMIPAVAVYGSVNILAKGLARRPARSRWERDESSRRVPQSRLGDATPPGQKAGVCYVTSHYPALSHTFVMREIMGVRAAGLRVETVSVHKTDQRELLAKADKEEAGRTWNILPLDRPTFLKAHARAVLGHPFAYFQTLARAVSWAPRGARDRIWQLFYFAEAIALWDHGSRVGTRHLHAHLANVAADVSLLASTFGKTAEPTSGWRWSFTMHGPTELYSTERFNLAHKVASADGVLCISEYTRSQLMYLTSPQHWEKLRVVHCGVDMEQYPYEAPMQGDGLGVLCVGRLAPQKGIDILVEAVGVLARRGMDIRLSVVGSGPLEASLRHKVRDLGLEDRVRFEGAVGQDDIHRFYVETDVFCLASFAEGVPIVLMEAMATGRPVVATRVAGVPELVEDGVSGLLVAPGSVEALVDALERLAPSRELRARMGLAGRQRVEQEFDSRRCAKQAADVFRAMAQAADNPGVEALG